jgi:hypothetical protein
LHDHRAIASEVSIAHGKAHQQVRNKQGQARISETVRGSARGFNRVIKNKDRTVSRRNAAQGNVRPGEMDVSSPHLVS